MNKKLLLILLLSVVSIGQIFALSTYHAKVTINAPQGEGAGKVYIVASADKKPDLKDYTDGLVSDSAYIEDEPNSTLDFFAYYRHVYGYKFDGWSSNHPQDSLKFDDFLIEKGCKVSVVPSSKSGDSNIISYIITPKYSKWGKDDGFDLTFEISDGVESYEILGPIGYPSSCISDSTVRTYNNDELTITAHPKEGYAVSKWWRQDSKDNKTGYDEITTSFLTETFTEKTSVWAEVGKCDFKVGHKLYDNIDSAIEYASNSDYKTIILTSNYTLHGEHTIPKGVTLLIPYDAAYTLRTDKPEISYPDPYEGGPLGAYRTLTLAQGAKLNVYGAISVGAKINARSGNKFDCAAGSPDGYYGHIVIEGGSEINLKSGSALYVPGFITGDGTVTAESGSTVYETMQIMDWRGGYASTHMPQGMFPFNQYYIQNIESALVIDKGAKEMLYVCVGTPTTKEKINFAITSFLDESASFFIKDKDAVVTKKYDKAHDKLIFDVNSGKITVNGLTMTVEDKTISSKSYNLPITNNMQFNLHAGSEVIFDEDQDAMLAAGAIINVDKNATLTVNSNLYVYDSEEWGNFASNANIRPLEYIPSTTDNKFVRTIGMALDDAQINVEGKIEVKGYLYTSKSGSNISGNEGGEVKYISAAASDDTFMTMAKNGSDYTENVDFTSAQLHNEDASYTPTKEAPAGSTFKYVGGEWVLIQGVELSVYTPESQSLSKVDLAEWPACQKKYPNALAIIEKQNVKPNITDYSNIIIKENASYSCNNFVLTDKAPIQVPVNFTAVNASYKRTGSSTWGTICMPFALDSDEDVQYYQFKSLDMEAGCMEFEEVDYVDANTPAIYSIAEGASELLLGGENLAVIQSKQNPNEYVAPNNAKELTLYGVLSQKSETLPVSENSPYYYIAQNKFWQPWTNEVTVAPMRAYFKTNSSTPVSARMFAIAKVERSEIEESEDVIEEIEDAIDTDNSESDVIADEPLLEQEGSENKPVEEPNVEVNEPDNVIIVDEPQEPEMKNETVEEVIAQPTSILMLPQGVSIVQYYNALGQKQSKLSKGLNIIKLSNGETRKIMIK